jgi:effector-binding domain-containing protein
MLYTLSTRTILPRAMAYTRVTCKPGEFSSVFSETQIGMLIYLHRQGGLPTGSGFVRYYQISDEQLDMEMGVLLSQPVAETDSIQVGELPGGLVAMARHIGPYNNLGKVYTAMQTWIEEQGYAIAGAPWEIYWTDPQEEPDSGRWKADVIWPLQ